MTALTKHLLLLLLLASTQSRAQHLLTTLAGVAPNNSPGSTDGPGSQARFNWPHGVALGPDGSLYVADTDSHTIRKISPAGVVTTVAGQANQSGYADGSGPQARFKKPIGVVVDAAGTVYVADQENHTIRKITPAGEVSTLAGTPTRAWRTKHGPEVLPLEKPTGLALGPGNTLYVTDQGTGCIYKIDAVGKITTFIGPEQYVAFAQQAGGRFRGYSLAGLAVGADGTVYVGDSDNASIRKISPAGVLSAWVGNGGGYTDGNRQQAQLGNPTGLALTADGTLYVADERFNVIRCISPAGDVRTVAGEGDLFGNTDAVGAAARFTLPYGIAVDARGTLYVADELNFCIRKIEPNGRVST